MTAFGTGVDQAVAELGYTHNRQGLLKDATSYDASGVVVNQVERTYNGLGQLLTDAQDTSTTVSSSTPTVSYGYSDPSTGSRLTSMTYPNGRVITYNYGASGSLDDSIGRLSCLSDSTGTLQRYGYQGLSTVLQETDGTYTYDRDGNVLTKGNPLNTALSDVYTYDNLIAERFEYDPYGARIVLSSSWGSCSGLSGDRSGVACTNRRLPFSGGWPRCRWPRGPSRHSLLEQPSLEIDGAFS